LRKILSITIVVFLVLGGLGAVATPQEQNFENEKINVAFTKLSYEDEGNYITINVEEANDLLIEEGKPLLPMYTHQIVLPYGTKVKSVKVTPKNIVEKTLPKEITPSPVAITIGSQVKTNNIQTSEISDPYPASWYDYDIRVGLKNNEKSLIIDTYFYPVSCHPKEGTISWAKEAEITVEFEPDQKTTVLNEGYDFIILTADEFYDELTPLVDHKTNRDVSTKIVKLSEILNGAYFPVMGDDDAEKVKYFIYQAADEEQGWNTKNVMLVGNKDKFPIRETHIKVSSDDKEIFASDLYFADILMYNEETEEYEFCSWDSNNNNIYAEYRWDAGTDVMDLEPDVAVGRLAANDEEEVTTIVNKIMTYESTEAYTQNWFFNMVYCGGDSFIDEQHDPNGVLEGEYVNEHVMEFMDGFIPEKMWVSNNVLSRLSPPTGVASISNAISEGCGFVDFSGHGNTDVWATHPHLNDGKWLPAPFGQYHSINIEQLTNGDKLPVVVTGACSVSKFSKDKTCFSWTFLSTNGGGGIGSFGATGLGYAYISTYVISGLVEGMAIETFSQYDEGAITLGEMWTRALNGYMGSHNINGGGEYKTVLEWELFGDPTLSLRDQSTPPEKPQKPSGPTSGKTGEELSFTSSVTDVDDDEVYLLFDWGDGEFSDWIGPKNSGQEVTASHTWSSAGDFSIRVKAKDEHGILGEWSDPLLISLSKGKSIVYRPFLSRIFELFPWLEKIFNF
jgi:hypothetical protein